MNITFRSTIGKALALAVLFLFGGLWSVPAAHAEDHPLLQAIETVFKRSQTEDLKEYGLDNSQHSPGDYAHTIKGCWLKKGENKIYTPRLDPNVEYAVIAGGDNTATKIKIKILDAQGRRAAKPEDPMITESSEDNNAPGAVFRLSKKQTIGIQVTLEEVDENAGKESAYVAFLLLRKDAGWEVPLENLKAAAVKLQARLDKVREANGGSADLMYSWFSIHGGVIPKGSKSANTHFLKPGKKYIVVAASDDNTESLDVQLDGNYRGVNDSETTDDTPKVTYKKGAKVTYETPWNGYHIVKNNGDTSVVLIAIIELIEGS